MKTLLPFLAPLLFVSALNAQLVISEVQLSTQTVEVTNISGAPFTPTNWEVCVPFSYGTFPSIEIPTGGVVLLHIGTSGTNTVTDFYFPFTSAMTASDTFLLYTQPPFFVNDNIVDFVSWGGGTSRITQAVTIGEWPDALDTVIIPVGPNSSIAFIGGPAGSSSWIQEGNHTLGSPNLAGSFSFGQGCSGAGGVVELAPDPANDVPEIAGSMTLQVSNLPNSSPGDLPFGFFGFSNVQDGVVPLPLDLSILGMTGCTLYTSINRSFSLPNNAGSSTWNISIPDRPELFGFRFFLQIAAIDSTIVNGTVPLVMSNAVEARVGQ